VVSYHVEQAGSLLLLMLQWVSRQVEISPPLWAVSSMGTHRKPLLFPGCSLVLLWSTWRDQLLHTIKKIADQNKHRGLLRLCLNHFLSPATVLLTIPTGDPSCRSEGYKNNRPIRDFGWFLLYNRHAMTKQATAWYSYIIVYIKFLLATLRFRFFLYFS
jgi:hypothetical protein